MPRALRFPLSQVALSEGRHAFMPRLQATIEGLDVWFGALVDTGAGITVISSGAVRQLGYDDERIRAGEQISLMSFRNEVTCAWLHRLTLQLRASPSSGLLEFRDLECAVSEHADDDVLLGQRGLLELLEFFQDGPAQTAGLLRSPLAQDG